MADQFGVEPDALRQLSARVGVLGCGANPVLSAAQARIAAKGRACGELGDQFADGPGGSVRQLAAVAASVGAQAALLDGDAQRLRYTCGRFEAIRAGLGLGYLISGSALVMGFSDGGCVFSMRGVDDDGDVCAAVTVGEMN